MKILIISPGYLPITGNHGGAIESLINTYLKHNEYEKDEITVYTVKNSTECFDRQIYKNTKFRTIDMTKKKFKLEQKLINVVNKFVHSDLTKNYIRLVVKDIVKKHEENYYDLIIFENGQGFIKYFRNKIDTKTRIALHIHNDYLNVDTKDAKKILSLFDEVWTVSKYIKGRVDAIEYRENKVKVLYNTIDYSLFQKELSTEEKEDLIKKYNLDNDFVFICVGRVMAEKGTLELVKAFTNLNKKYKNIKLFIVGGNKSLKENDSYVEEVHNIAGNNQNIIFTGQVNNAEAYKYYQLADVQIIPSKWNEAFGLIALEGVASNLPIIATNSGGLPEILGDSGIYVDREILVNDLESKMKKILDERDVLKSMVEDYPKIIDKFSKEKYCETFYNLMNK